MGRKVPMWQCLIVIIAMVGLLMWSILMDNGGEPHIALILAAAVAAIVARANGWKWAWGCRTVDRSSRPKRQLLSLHKSMKTLASSTLTRVFVV